jgi:hypothetical protein
VVTKTGKSWAETSGIRARVASVWPASVIMKEWTIMSAPRAASIAERKAEAASGKTCWIMSPIIRGQLDPARSVSASVS